MTRQRFVTPLTSRVQISDGDWIEFRTALTYGEELRLGGALMKSIRPGDDTMDIDWAKHRVLRIEYWVADWSLKDSNGKSVRFSRQAIETLDTDTAGEINEALDKHLERMQAEKKEQALANGNG